MWFHLEMLLTGKVIGVLLLVVLMNMIIGSVWYSQKVFGGLWQSLAGIKWEDADPVKAMSGKALSALLMSAVMACFIVRLGFNDIRQGMELGFMLWLGFMMTSALDGVLFANKPSKLFLINTGCDLLQMMVMGAVLVYFLPR